MRERTSGGTVLVEVRATFRRGAPAVVRDRDGEVRTVNVADVGPVQRRRERELCERRRGNSRPTRPAVLDVLRISSCRVQDRARTYLLHSSPPLHCFGTSGGQRYPRRRVHEQLTPPVRKTEASSAHNSRSKEGTKTRRGKKDLTDATTPIVSCFACRRRGPISQRWVKRSH